MKQLYSKTLLWLLAFTVLFSGNVLAQQVITSLLYPFNRVTNGPTAKAWVSLIGSGADNAASPVTDIGFTFWFAGTPYTQFSVSENGLMTLGSTPISGTDVTNDMASSTTLPKIAPYWDDLATGTTGSVGYFLEGAAPSRTLWINWNVTVPKNTAGAPNTNFQVKLVEAYNQIVLVRGATPINAGAYTIGIGKSATDYASVNALAASATSVYYPAASVNTHSNAINACSYNYLTDYTAPTISTQTIPNSGSLGDRILTKTISDAGSGIPTTGLLVPRIYYKKGVGGTYVSQPGVWTTPSTWNFTVIHSLIGGVVPGDQVYYYVVAQDQSASGRINIGSNPAGVVATNVNTITTPPLTPSVYTIGSSFSGTKTVGTGGDFTSLTSVGGLFEQLNGGQLTGNLTVNIISDISETAGTMLNAWANDAGGPYTVTIRPIGARTISTYSGGLTFNGTQSLTLDGLNDGINSLTINNVYAAAIDLRGGASNNTIKNCTLKGTGASSGGAVIVVNNTTSIPCNTNIISNNYITSSNLLSATYDGILFTGTGSTGTGNIIDHNTFTNLGYSSIHKGFTTTSRFVNFTISNNEIYNTVAVSQRHYFKGIWIEGASGTSSIFNNEIHDLDVSFNTMAGDRVWAIHISNIAGDITNIYNNVIYLDATSNNPLQAWTGIYIANAGTTNIHYNSVYIGGSSSSAYTAKGIEKAAFGTADIRNNVTYIARTGSINSGMALLGTYTQTNNYSGNPGFTSPTNLQPDIANLNAANLNDHGIPIATIGTDILGNPRSTSLPVPTDIGAYEFVIPNPIAFAVTGTGFYFPGGFGLPVGLADSETGVTYTLFKDDVAQLPTIQGTGEPITFGDQLFGVYTVSGTNLLGTTLMTGNATITVTPLPALPNVALNKTATGQGTILTGYEPSKANDADGTNGNYWTGSQFPKWWKVDLGGYYDLSAIVIRNYVDGIRYYQYNIEASLDDDTYTQIASKSNTNVATNAGDAFSVSVTARYLRVNMTNHSLNPEVHITDFRAYGTVNTSSHVITAIAGPGGSLSPSGAVGVANGTDQTFTITPDFGYQIADVLIDGSSIGPVTSYTFAGVATNHDISATFAALENVALNKTATGQGTILTGYEPSKANDADGTNGNYWTGSQFPKWWKVDLGGYYDLSAIVIRNYVDGIRYYQYNIEASLDDDTYTQIASKSNTNVATNAGDAFSVSVTARYLRVNMTNHSLNPEVHITDFRAYGTVNTSSHVITAIAGPGGSLSPSGAVGVANGTDQTFTITPDFGYQIADVLIDGSSIGPVTSYTFAGVATNHDISATFAALENVALNKTATGQGTILTGYEPSKANDADGTNGNYWTGSQFPKWWKVDLGGYYDLSAIVIRNYVDGIRYYQYNIEASLDDDTYTQIASKSNTNVATNAGDAFSVSVTARYLRVNMTNHSLNPEVHITDFRAYGTVNTSSHVITAIAGPGGSLSPSGAVGVANGTDQTFTITPDFGYQIADVLIDGSSIGPVTSYTFAGVATNHDISATFAALENVALNKTATGQGTILTGYEPSKANDADGTNGNYWTGSQFPKWWKVDLGGYYDLSAIVIRNYVDGIRYYQYNIEASLDDDTYTQIASKSNTNVATNAGDAFSVSVTARYLRVNMTNHSLNPEVHITDFRAYGTVNTSSHVITAIAGPGGSLSPSGAVGVANGTDQTFTITPDFGYQIADVLIDGSSIGPVTSYTFAGVATNHDISATFAALENVALNKTATGQGTILTGYEPSKANDADGTNGNYWTGSQFPKWWKVDLGGYYDLSAIVIRNYVDGIRYYQYNIEASLDDDTYTQIASKSNTNVATNAGDAFSVSVTARYLRVNMTNHSLNPEVHITDFRAYGTVNTSSHVITAIAGPGGSLSPSGAVGVANGTDQTFTITPDFGYQIADVLIDGSSIGPVTSYTFAGVATNHDISATFAALENVALNKTATGQGTILTGYEPSKANDADGTNGNYWTGSQFPKWWKVDLGGYYDLSAIVIRNYVDGIRYYQYNIEASLDDDTYTQIASKSNTNVATNAGDAFSVSVTARYLRVNMTNHSLNPEVHITDFRAYGTVQGGAKGSNSSVSPSGKQDILTETLKQNFKVQNIKVNVYPNPFCDHFTLRIDSPDEEMYDISIINLKGETILLRTQIQANIDNTINLQLAKGIYILRVNSKGKMMIHRIVKE